MPAFPWPLPLTGYAGLGNGTAELTTALNYARQPITLEMTDDGITAANLETQEWGTAGNDWGPISSVLVYDAPTGGNLLLEAILAGSGTPYSWGDYSAGVYSQSAPSLLVHMYDRVRVSASSLTAIAIAGPAAEGTANAVILTFGVIYPCSAGTWAPGPYARAA